MEESEFGSEVDDPGVGTLHEREEEPELFELLLEELPLELLESELPVDCWACAAWSAAVFVLTLLLAAFDGLAVSTSPRKRPQPRSFARF
jgi:hypothetical protein